MVFDPPHEGLAAGWPSLDAGIPTFHTLEPFCESIPAAVLLLCSVECEFLETPPTLLSMLVNEPILFYL